MHCKSYSHFFSKKFQNICVSLDVNFNESLTNNVVSFEQLGSGVLDYYFSYFSTKVGTHKKHFNEVLLMITHNICFVEIPKRVIWQKVQTQIRCHGMQRVISNSAVCKYFSHFSLGISKSHSLPHLKLKSGLSKIFCLC